MRILQIILVFISLNVFGQSKDAFKFDSIYFETSPKCFGWCPFYKMQIDSDRNIKLHSIIVYKKGTEFDKDSTKQGRFVGVLSKKKYAQLLSILKSCNLETLSYYGENCCDAPYKTLVVNYNNKVKEIQIMHPKNELATLVIFLYEIIDKNKFRRTEDLWTF
jgi:hypothetical protein